MNKKGQLCSSSVHGDFPGKNTGVVAMPSHRDLPNPGIKIRSPTLQADSLPSGPSGKSKNTGVGSLSLLQGNFPTQESNRELGSPVLQAYSLPAELPGKPYLQNRNRSTDLGNKLLVTKGNSGGRGREKIWGLTCTCCCCCCC